MFWSLVWTLSPDKMLVLPGEWLVMEKLNVAINQCHFLTEKVLVFHSAFVKLLPVGRSVDPGNVAIFCS